MLTVIFSPTETQLIFIEYILVLSRKTALEVPMIATSPAIGVGWTNDPGKAAEKSTCLWRFDGRRGKTISSNYCLSQPSVNNKKLWVLLLVTSWAVIFWASGKFLTLGNRLHRRSFRGSTAFGMSINNATGSGGKGLSGKCDKPDLMLRSPIEYVSHSGRNRGLKIDKFCATQLMNIPIRGFI